MDKIAREAINLNYVNYAKELDNLLHSDTEQVNIVCRVFVALNLTFYIALLTEKVSKYLNFCITL